MRFSDVVVSAAWVETNPRLLAAAPPPSAPLLFLGNRDDYSAAFEAVNRRGHVHPLGLELPWPRPTGQMFWTRYFEKPPRDVDGVEGWKALVPFRLRPQIAIGAPWLPGRVWAETFHFPHGLGLVVSASVKPDLPLDQVVALLHRFRHDNALTITSPGAAPRNVNLDQMADALTAASHEFTFGEGVPRGRLSEGPFTVVTFLRGSGVSPTGTTLAQGAVHRALEAVTRWSNTWQTDTLPPLDVTTCLDAKRGPASHVLYARRRGRAVWFPVHFNAARGNTLSCYHRNLTLAGLQVESLSGLALATDEARRQGANSSVTHDGCARRAAGILGRMYGGAFTTYRSQSARAHIDQNAWVAPISAVRGSMGPLK